MDSEYQVVTPTATLNESDTTGDATVEEPTKRASLPKRTVKGVSFSKSEKTLMVAPKKEKCKAMSDETMQRHEIEKKSGHRVFLPWTTQYKGERTVVAVLMALFFLRLT